MTEKTASDCRRPYTPDDTFTRCLAPQACRTIEDSPPSFHFFPDADMELFNPALHLPQYANRAHEGHSGPSGALPSLPLNQAARVVAPKALIPRVEDCHALWDRYQMLDNIRAHSLRVAEFAHCLALMARERGVAVSADAVLAAGLLHDLAKTYTIAHGGNHAQLGAAWVMQETRNPAIARAVLFHVYWPWEQHAFDERLFLLMIIEYADKRVRHDCYVTLAERFEDLQERYGVNEFVRGRIRISHEQGERLEEALSRRLGVNLHECIVDSGRLVKRT